MISAGWPAPARAAPWRALRSDLKLVRVIEMHDVGFHVLHSQLATAGRCETFHDDAVDRASNDHSIHLNAALSRMATPAASLAYVSINSWDGFLVLKSLDFSDSGIQLVLQPVHRSGGHGTTGNQFLLAFDLILDRVLIGEGLSNTGRQLKQFGLGKDNIGLQMLDVGFFLLEHQSRLIINQLRTGLPLRDPFSLQYQYVLNDAFGECAGAG